MRGWTRTWLPVLLPASLALTVPAGAAQAQGLAAQQTPQQTPQQAGQNAARDRMPDPGDPYTRGAYIAREGDCAACHTADGGKPYAGGYPIRSPLGTIYSSNITPSASSGIGGWSEKQFARALREGIAADGTHLYPAMPYDAYSAMTDGDVHALYTFLMHKVAPVDDKPAHETALGFPYNMRWLMAGWNALFLDKQPFAPKPGEAPQIARGRYLVDVQGHCSSCHTPRNFFMANDKSAYLAGAAVGGWHAPNITSDPVSGIGGWSTAELVAYFRNGHVDGKAQAAGGMAEAVEKSLSHLSDPDLQAIAAYLKTVPGQRTPGQTQASYTFGESAGGYRFDDARSLSLEHQAAAARPDARTALARRADAKDVTSGALLYESACATCHQPNGSGTADGYYPTLFHNSATGSHGADNLVMAILSGVDRVGADGPTHMPAFANDMTDTQVAAVANFVARTYGNPALTVSPEQVAVLRAGGPEPSLQRAMPGMIGGALALALALAAITWRRLSRRPLAS